MIDHRIVRALHVERLRKGDMGADLDASHAIFQTSTLDALLDGAYDGDVTFAELSERGDTGLGTLDALDGEMIALGGEFFQARANGSVRRIAPTERTPFAVVARFEPDVHATLAGPLEHAALLGAIDALVEDREVCYALRIDGRFEAVRARSVPAQKTPYPPLAEVIAHQQEFELGELTGSIVGFQFPDYTQGLNVSGYHLHVISDARDAGGHLLDCRLLGGTLALDHSSDLHMELPVGVNVAEADTSERKRAAIERLEGET